MNDVRGLTAEGKEVALKATGACYRICNDSESAQYFKAVITKGAERMKRISPSKKR